MTKRVLLAACAVAVAVGFVVWQDYEDDHDETCFEQQTITYAAGSEGTQPPLREYDC
jgi:hypothetical protein